MSFWLFPKIDLSFFIILHFKIVQTKPRRFFFGGSFCGVLRGGAGSGENSPGQKLKFFPAMWPRAGKNLSFSSPTLPRRGKFWFFPRHGGELAHFCVFWRGICTFGEEFVCFGEEILARPPPARKSFPKILARPPRAGKIWKFSPPNPPRPNWRGKIPRPRHSPPLNFSPRRGLVQTFL